jgi:DNA-binding GntR family transcriptional regulator
MPQSSSKTRLSPSVRVEQHIRQAIFSGALKPRERVIEEDLAKQLQCSRGPVREALLRLERDGLIVTVPRRGTFIRDISPDSIEVIFSMRAKLEGLCVRYLRQDLTGESETALQQALSRMKAAASKGDEERFLQADMELHRTIWRLSRREPLSRTLTTIMNPFIFMVARAFSSQMPLKHRYLNHEEYVEMILTAPISRVERQVEDYFRKLFESLGIQVHTQLLMPDSATRPTIFSDFEA